MNDRAPRPAGFPYRPLLQIKKGPAKFLPVPSSLILGGGGEDRTPDLGVMNPKLAYFLVFQIIQFKPLLPRIYRYYA